MIDFKTYKKILLFNPLIFVVIYLLLFSTILIPAFSDNRDMTDELIIFIPSLLVFSVILFESLKHGVFLFFENSSDAIETVVDISSNKALLFTKAVFVQGKTVYFKYIYSNKSNFLCGMLNNEELIGKYKILYLPKSKIVLEIDKVD